MVVLPMVVLSVVAVVEEVVDDVELVGELVVEIQIVPPTVVFYGLVTDGGIQLMENLTMVNSAERWI